MASVQQAVVAEFNIGEWFVQDYPALHLLLSKPGGKTFKCINWFEGNQNVTRPCSSSSPCGGEWLTGRFAPVIDDMLYTVYCVDVIYHMTHHHMISKHVISYQVERVQPLLWGGKSKQEGRVCSGRQVEHILAFSGIWCSMWKSSTLLYPVSLLSGCWDSTEISTEIQMPITEII